MSRLSKSSARSWRAFDPDAVVKTAAPVVVAVATQAVVLGLDPGSRRTGFGVIKVRGSDTQYLSHGCINASQGSFHERLRVIFEQIRQLIDQHAPDEVAIEQVFVKRNVASALKLGQARGAALCALNREMPVFEYAPRAVKLAVAGSGGAEKQQVAHMVAVLLQLREQPTADGADALAIALCHAHTRRLLPR
jgi:crossover junction endodeoxyribonuclease RuvC